MLPKNRILVIEDDLIAAEILGTVLSEKNVKYDIIDQSKFYQSLFGQLYNYDLIITDLYMPDINGVEVYTWTKSAYPDLPVVAFSSNPHSTVITFDDVIHKPVDPAQVHGILKRYGLGTK